MIRTAQAPSHAVEKNPSDILDSSSFAGRQNDPNIFKEAAHALGITPRADHPEPTYYAAAKDKKNEGITPSKIDVDKSNPAVKQLVDVLEKRGLSLADV